MTILEDYLKRINYTEEDLQDFQSIGAVFVENKKILMMDHVKFNFWTVPIGKVKAGQTVEEGLKEELSEELAIDALKYRLLGIWKRTFTWKGKRIKTENFLYLIENYRGRIRNNEPQKHRTLKFMTMEEIKKKRVSEMTKVLLKLYDKGKFRV